MDTIRSVYEILDHWDYFEESWKGIFGFFLYSNVDRQIVNYIRKYFNDLHHLSGSDCLIFLIDKPLKKWDIMEETKDYQKEFIYKTSDRKGFNDEELYDRTKSYKIADFFGIAPKALPCIVFFKNIDETELLVFLFKNSWNEEKISIKLREIFSVMKMDEEHIYSNHEDENRKERIWKHVKKYIRKEYIEQKIMGIITHPNTISIGQTFRKILLY